MTEIETSRNVIVKLFSYNNLIHAFAGASGSVVAMATFYPLDVMRTFHQVDDKRTSKGAIKAVMDYAKDNGLKSLYIGLAPVLVSVYCSNFVYFYTFRGLKAVSQTKHGKTTVSMDLLLGYLAGLVNSFVTTPLWVANTRLKLQSSETSKSKQTCDPSKKKYTGLIDCMLKIYYKEGVRGLWAGVQTSLLLSGNPAIHFTVYESVKRFLIRIKTIRYNHADISSLEYFFIGGFAKMVATVLTYPLQLAQCRQRAGKRNSELGTDNKSLFDIMQDVMSHSGIAGLYKGMETKLYQTVLTTALMFVAYEKIVNFIYAIFISKNKTQIS